MLTGIVLFQALLWIFADADIEALRRVAPNYVNKIWVAGDAAHKYEWAAPKRSPEIGCGGWI
ncbi:MAG: hypothetical protein AUI53_06820 [Acidobacteria bacterium 13_1_40CM_2_60_7]|nr:MAG: hypothetical protein AUI53_06820 [Acidobacteria bacterium 13_1_40CM_2_60_7]